jgi:hypothetical protein
MSSRTCREPIPRAERAAAGFSVAGNAHRANAGFVGATPMI